MVIYKYHPWNKKQRKVNFLNIELESVTYQVCQKSILRFVNVNLNFNYQIKIHIFCPFYTFSRTLPFLQAHSAKVHFILCDYVS